MNQWAIRAILLDPGKIRPSIFLVLLFLLQVSPEYDDELISCMFYVELSFFRSK